MGFLSALPDRCRTIRESNSDVTRYGTPVKNETVYSEWIRCRLDDTGGDAQSMDNDARQRFAKRPSIMINKKDIKGKPVSLLPNEKLEVTSATLPQGFWQIQGRARIVRTRTKLHHFEGTVLQVTDSAADDSAQAEAS